MPHVTFPLSRGMDRLIITPPGEKAPPIGEDIREVDELRIARRGGRGEYRQERAIDCVQGSIARDPRKHSLCAKEVYRGRGSHPEDASRREAPRVHRMKGLRGG
jgi:hypothetical protein